MNFRIKAVYVLVCCVLLSACEVGEKIDEYCFDDGVCFYIFKKNDKIYFATAKGKKYYDIQRPILETEIIEKDTRYATAKILKVEDYEIDHFIEELKYNYLLIIECSYVPVAEKNNKLSNVKLPILVDKPYHTIEIDYEGYLVNINEF
jgi:lipoprotein